MEGEPDSSSQSSFDSYISEPYYSDNEDSFEDDGPDNTNIIYTTYGSDNEDSSQDDWTECTVISNKRRNSDNESSTRGGTQAGAKRQKQEHNQTVGEEPRVPLHEIHEHQHRDTWLQVLVQKTSGAEPVGSVNQTSICVYNTNIFIKKDLILTKFKDSIIGKELFYHGTTRDSAKSIIEHGIDVTKSTRRVDFSAGKGFYVTNDYVKACKWSKRKSTHSSKPAVIIFKIDSDMRNEKHLTLKVDNDTNRKAWERIVSHFRRGETSPDVTRELKDVKYIEGPVAKEKSLSGDQIPTPADNGSFLQLCICDQGYANKFGSLANILCVIFITD